MIRALLSCFRIESLVVVGLCLETALLPEKGERRRGVTNFELNTLLIVVSTKPQTEI